MKQITLIFSLLITSLLYSQYQPFELTVNYGSEVTLGADLSYKLQNNIIGFGYAGYIGSNSYEWNLENNNYHLKNESFYLIYSRQFKTWVFGIKFGKQNTADYNKKVLFYNSLGNPHYYFEKDANSYNTMVGGNIGYCLFDNFRITVGVDTFSKFTLGFTAGF